MGLAYNTYLNSNKIYGCKNCKAHLSNHDDIISRVSLLSSLNILSFSDASIRAQVSPNTNTIPFATPQPIKQHKLSSAEANLAGVLSLSPPILLQNFRGQHGKAYLFNSVVNIDTGDPSERNMTTGRHIVRDISCRQCKETVGWKYDKAYESSEKYKEGKFILEAELLCNVS